MTIRYRYSYMLFRKLAIFWMVVITVASQARDIVTVDSIRIQGNKVTRDGIILRECMFAEGMILDLDSLDAVIKRSEENLINTGLFNFATISKDFSDSTKNHVLITVEVVERWYVWPTPIFNLADRNFNVWWETRDLSRVSYGFYIDWKNFTGRMDKLRALMQFGYDQALSFEYSLPYLNRKKTWGAGISANFSQSHEVAAATNGNEHVFYKKDDGFASRKFSLSLKSTIRNGYYNTHEFNVNYSLYRFDDSLVILYPWYSSGSDEDEFLSLSYKYKSDHRDYRAYPLEGHYFDLELFKVGLGLLKDKGPEFFTAGTTFRGYFRLNRFMHYAFGINGMFSNQGFQPYYLVRGIGYGRDNVRGYEYYVVDASSFAIFKNNLKFTLFSKPDARIPFIRSDRFGRLFYGFYLNVFFDMGYADQSFYYGENDNLHNELLTGYGIGLDFTTYYDVVIRAEYSFNHLGESGLFIHFMASI